MLVTARLACGPHGRCRHLWGARLDPGSALRAVRDDVKEEVRAVRDDVNKERVRRRG